MRKKMLTVVHFPKYLKHNGISIKEVNHTKYALHQYHSLIILVKYHN